MPSTSFRLPIPSKPEAEEPHLFGRGIRDRLLMMLAVNDRPLFMTEMATALGSDLAKLRKAVNALVGMGVLADVRRPCNVRYVGLDPAFPAYHPLRRLLVALERRWPQPRFGKPPRTAERLGLRGLRLRGTRPSRDPEHLDRLFYSPPRTRALLFIAAMGSTDVTDIIETVGLDRRSAWNVANHWQREGVLRSVIVGRRRALELNPDFPEAREVRRFLKKLVSVMDEYQGLARTSTRRVGGPRFVTLR